MDSHNGVAWLPLNVAAAIVISITVVGDVRPSEDVLCMVVVCWLQQLHIGIG